MPVFREATVENRVIWKINNASKDFSIVVDYLTTLPYVDAGRIGVLGICGGGGYAINAAMTERRIKAIGTVTGANYGRLMREGFTAFNPIGALEAMAQQRTDEANGAKLRVDDLPLFSGCSS